jgi:hypothetical protein
MKRAFLAALCLCVFAGPVLGQSVSISGTVVRAGSTERLSKARVELRNDGGQNPLVDSITTEDDGRFQFLNVRPARYRLSVVRQGYVRSPVTLTVVAGRETLDVQLSMYPAAAISGRIYDGSGEPMGNIEVQVLKTSYPQGRRMLRIVDTAITNDLGEYRLFGLPAGRYYIAAVHPEAQSAASRMIRNTAGGTVAVGINGLTFYSRGDIDPALESLAGIDAEDNANERYVPIYYPGTPSEGNASAVEVRAGSDFGGVNIAVSPLPPRHVRGMVVDSSGRPINAGVTAGRQDFGPARPGTDTTTVNGAFDLVLLPGMHLLIASSGEGIGYTAVQVENADVENVIITPGGSFNLSGKLLVQSKAGVRRDLSQLRFILQRDSLAGLLAKPTSYSFPLADGSLTLAAGVGDFRVNISPLPQDLYVKSIRFGDTDVLNGSLHLAGPTSTPLEIVLSDEVATVEGTVVNDQRQPASDISVVLVPDARLRTDLYRTTVTDPSGHFRFDRIAPGDYRVFAWTEVETDAWFDSEFIRGYENLGQSIHLREGLTETVRITPIP